MQPGFQLKLYMHENTKHEGILLYQWLIEKGKKMNLHGGTVFRAITGFGRDSIIYEEHFFESASNLPLEAVFILDEEQCERFLSEIRKENLNILFVKIPLEYGYSASSRDLDR